MKFADKKRFDFFQIIEELFKFSIFEKKLDMYTMIFILLFIMNIEKVLRKFFASV